MHLGLIKLAVSPTGIAIANLIQRSDGLFPASEQAGRAVGNGFNYYVPWSVDTFNAGIADLLSKIGTATNVGFWIFILVTGVYLVVKIVDSLGR